MPGLIEQSKAGATENSGLDNTLIAGTAVEQDSSRLPTSTLWKRKLFSE